MKMIFRVLRVFIFLGLLSVPFVAVYAQDNGEVDVRKEAFDDSRKGCSKKLGFFMAVKKQYTKGVERDRVFGGSKIMSPLVDDVYNQIQKDGLDQAMLSAMQDFDSCMQKQAEKEKDQQNKSAGYEQALKCDSFSKMLNESFNGAKNKKDQEGIINKYKGRLNLSGTNLEDLENPVDLIVPKIYSFVSEGNDNTAIEYISSLNFGCYGR